MSEHIEALVEQLRETLDEIDWLGRKPRPILRDPATDEEIAALTKAWGRPLPPSYETFLRLCNGMDGADQYDWAIAGATEPKSGESFSDVKAGHIFAFKQQDPNHAVVKDLKKTFIAGSDFDFQVVYWDPATLSEDEPKLRRVGQDAAYERYPLYNSFEEFLSFVVDGYDDLLAFQNEPMDDGKGGYSKEDEALLMELAALLDNHAPEREPEPAKLSPEMQLAADLCELALDKLIDRGLVELVEAPSIREGLEDYMLRKLLRSKSPQETIDAWIDALSKAREVEELYGTDDELGAAMLAAFEEISTRQS